MILEADFVNTLNLTRVLATDNKQLPIEVSTIVTNVATAAAIADAVIDGRPLIDRITTSRNAQA